MNLKRVLVLLATLFLALSAWGQLQVNGYLSSEYAKGQRDSDFPKGTFDNVSAGLFFFGKAGNTFDYDLELRFLTVKQVEIEEAWVGIGSSPTFHLKVGFYLVPFGKYNTSSRPYQTRFIETPLPQAYLFPESWRDIGLLAEGRSSFLSYSVYLGNGLREAASLQSGQQFSDNNKDKGTGGRIGLFLTRSFETGFSYYRSKYDEANSRNLSLFGADLTWDSDPVYVIYEYTRADIDNPADFAKGAARGHYVLFALKLADFSAWGSYQSLDYTDPYHGEGFVEGESAGSGISYDLSRWAAGLTYYASSSLWLKLEYDFNSEGQVSLKNDVFFAQMALRF